METDCDKCRKNKINLGGKPLVSFVILLSYLIQFQKTEHNIKKLPPRLGALGFLSHAMEFGIYFKLFNLYFLLSHKCTIYI